MKTETYDIVLCSLALHHFSDDDAVPIAAPLPRTFARESSWWPICAAAGWPSWALIC